MKSLITLIYSLLITSFIASAQTDTITIKHLRYSTTFDTVLKYPVLVHWTVTKSDLCKKGDPKRVERESASFKADPLLKKYTSLQKYYTKSGYQRGHNMNAADNSCNLQQMKESFTSQI